MKKKARMAIFNVGAGFSSFVQTEDKHIMIDCGKSEDFSPVEDFLIPLAKKQGWKLNSEKEKGKYALDQLVITHPHQDHVSEFCKFEEKFVPGLVTCPNDAIKKDSSYPNYQYDKDEKLNWSKINSEGQELTAEQKELKIITGPDGERSLPLRPCLGAESLKDDTSQLIYRLLPGRVEGDDELCGESYPNNVSLVQLLKIKGVVLLIPGDIQKAGMKSLLSEKPIRGVYESNVCLRLKQILKKCGVDILIAPHHGHKSSFSSDLFDCLPENRISGLTVISEKPIKDGKTDVDDRYYGKKYNKGIDFDRVIYHWGRGGEEGMKYSVCTSVGHIGIEFPGDGDYNIHLFKTDDKKGLLEFFEG